MLKYFFCGFENYPAVLSLEDQEVEKFEIGFLDFLYGFESCAWTWIQLLDDSFVERDSST